MAKTELKTNTEAPEAVSPVAKKKEPESFEVSLDNFCSELSQSDKRVELIGGFHHTETKAGRMKDFGSAYLTRFLAFVNQPA